jgi:hypothetical protein
MYDSRSGKRGKLHPHLWKAISGQRLANRSAEYRKQFLERALLRGPAHSYRFDCAGNSHGQSVPYRHTMKMEMSMSAGA